ncbi:MAG: gamma-glutamyl-gamma-aminobutyrate hydrolase family protein [Rhodospirillales bacterium]
MSGAASNGRPVIGVTTSRHQSLLTWLCHWFAIWRAGGQARRIMPGDNVPAIGEFDGLVIGGGDDIGADLYKGELTLDIKTDPDRDRLEQRLLAEALDADLPVLGICRGSQMINIHLGGNLHRDIYEIYSEKRRLRTVLPRMDVHIEKGTKLNSILDRSSYRVNSLHHQAVDRLGDGLRIAARDDHGVVQATECTDRNFLIGVQWHPEFLILSSSQQSLFRALLDAARKRREKG